MAEWLITLLNCCIPKAGEDLYLSIKHHICYLIRCKRYVKELTNEVDRLRAWREHLQVLVEEARRNGDDIYPIVQDWITKVENFEANVKEIADMDEKNMKCLKGWHPNCRSRYCLGKEAKMKINDVKDLHNEGGKFSTIASVALRPPPASFDVVRRGDFEANESTRSTMDQIMEALKDVNISIVGVFGMGGVGKTTLVTEVGNQVSTEKLFKVVMVTVSQNSVEEIQGEIAENLGMKLEVKASTQRKAKLFSRLKQETHILLILDDLWKELELGEVGIPIGEDHKGCKIVLTSRSRDVCNLMKCQAMIKVDVLSEQDSWKLFKTSVGDVADSPELHNIPHKVVMECGGLPLAIVTVGRSMRNNSDLMIWNDLLWQLKSSDPITIDGIRDKVFSIIALSYNRLESEVIKLCFLFCCLFPEDYEIDVNVLTFYGIAEGFIKACNTLEQARNRVHAIVQNLKARCLLLDGSEEGYVKLHDVVRDVAIWIASNGEHKFLVKARAQMENVKAEEWQGCKRVSRMNCNIASVDNEMLGNQNQGLLTTLLLQNNASLEKLPYNLFEGMKSLVVLDLSHTRISTLPPSFLSLVSLRMLCLDYCENLKDVSQLGGVKTLQTLHLRWTNIQALTEEIGELTNLIFLDLRETVHLETIAPNLISRLVCLQELYMDNSFSGWEMEGNASIAEVGSLTQLTSLGINIEDEEKLPPSPSIGQTAIFQNLGQLTIGSNSSLKSAFPLSVAQGLLHLETLTIFGNSEMEEVISMQDGEVVDQRIFPQLKTLVLFELDNLKRFYRASVVLDWPSLESIHNFRCFELKSLPIGLQSAPNLKKIEGPKGWFEGVVWEDDSVKKRLQTLFQELYRPSIFSIQDARCRWRYAYIQNARRRRRCAYIQKGRPPRRGLVKRDIWKAVEPSLSGPQKQTLRERIR